MSRALVCDNCGTSLPLTAKGEHEGGEDSAWIVLRIANDSFDVCTRACAHEFLDSDAVIAAHDDYVESITGIAQSIREERSGRDERR